MIDELNPYLPPEAAPPAVGLNPWVSMWTQPRATIRQIVAEDPEKMVLVLVLLATLPGVLAEILKWSPGDDLFTTVQRIVGVAADLVFGLFGLYIGARLLSWTGQWLGGHASLKELRAVIAWSNIPEIWALPLSVTNLAIVNRHRFTAASSALRTSAALDNITVVLTGIQWAVWLWGAVVFLQALSEVQGFSVWRSLGNSLLTILFIVTPFFALFGLIVLAAA